MKFMRQLHVNAKNFGRCKHRTHVSVEMGGMNSHRHGSLDLGANLAFYFVGLGMLSNQGSITPQGSIGAEQTWNFVGGRDRTPAVSLPFASEREVQAQVCIGVCF